MKKESGLYWPDTEQHLNTIGIEYQRGIYDEALKYIPRISRNVFVDIGAHVGIFTIRASSDFVEVHSFEPSVETYACLKRNVDEAALYNVSLYNHAISADTCKVDVAFNTTNTGNSIPSYNKDTGSFDSVPLDFFNFQQLDLLKVDVEGFEVEVLKGAKETLQRCKPVVIIEAKGNGILANDPLAPIRMLRDELGFELVTRISNDYLFIPKSPKISRD